MIFNTHSRLAGQHAYLSASKNSWVNYDEDKFDRVYESMLAAARGTRQHDLAAFLIREGQKLPRSRKTLNQYVNDALGYRMTPEQVLYYSDNCFGTADTISFRTDKLRIHDLKTGAQPAPFIQLAIYAAIFCLEYNVRPFDIEMEFRIYQNDDFKVAEGDPDEVFRLMEKIKFLDRKITEKRMEGLL